MVSSRCKTHVFVVEDSPFFQQLLKETLASGGYDRVSFADSGEEALSMLGVTGNTVVVDEPDALLVDIMMPGIDGIDTCARIRADGRYQYTPILMVTAEAETESLAQAFVAGANDYVRKPFNSIELLARLRSALRLKGEIERRREREQEILAMTRDIRRTTTNTGSLFDGTSSIPGPPYVNAFFAALPTTCLQAMGVLAVQIDGLPIAANLSNGAVDNDRVARIGAMLADVPGRLGETLARYENGTFIAVMLASTPQELMRRAETVRQASLFFGQKSHADKGVTLSIGAVHGSAAVNSEPRTLLAKAVFAMERAALGGGDCVVLQNE